MKQYLYYYYIFFIIFCIAISDSLAGLQGREQVIPAAIQIMKIYGGRAEDKVIKLRY